MLLLCRFRSFYSSAAIPERSPTPLHYPLYIPVFVDECAHRASLNSVSPNFAAARVQTSLGQFRNTPYGTRQSRSPLVGRKCRPPLATRLPSSLLKTSIFSRCAELKRPHDMFFKKITSHPSRAPLTADLACVVSCFVLPAEQHNRIKIGSCKDQRRLARRSQHVAPSAEATVAHSTSMSTSPTAVHRVRGGTGIRCTGRRRRA